jgi:uncharacterized protein (TIGR00369 family)
MKKFKHNSESYVSFSELMLPSHSNFSGKIHGGYILSLMDQIAFACASKHSGYYCVTASVASVDFLKPIEIGELLTMQALVNYVGRSSMVIGIRVEAENVRTGATKHCNSSFFTMVAQDDDGNPAQVPGLVLKTEADVRRFAKSATRQQQKKARKIDFDDAQFDLTKHIEALKGYNIKLEL